MRRRNCGVDGRPVLFYARRHPLRAQPKTTRRTKRTPKPKRRHTELLDGLGALGLTSVSDEDVGAAMVDLSPEGTDGVEIGEVIRAVFLHLKRQESV